MTEGNAEITTRVVGVFNPNTRKTMPGFLELLLCRL